MWRRRRPRWSSRADGDAARAPVPPAATVGWGGGGVVRDVSWAPDGSALVGVGWDGGVCMWGARRGGSGLQSI